MTTPDFKTLFGHSPTHTADAPGRVNLIGDHTDYNGGFVLPMAIPQRTKTSLGMRSDNRVAVFTSNVGSQGELREFTLGDERASGEWLDYVQGVTAITRRNGFVSSGFDAWIHSEVPLGSGLSSSAALEVSLLRALRTGFHWSLDDVQLALLAQKVETDFVGAPVGVMDQMACSLSEEGEALFLDTRTLKYKKTALASGIQLIVINSGIKHSHVSGEYRVRRAQCEKAAEMMGVAQLSDLKPQDLAKLDALPEPLGSRARHVVTENQRVLDFVKACAASDTTTLGRLFTESHASMRDDFEVSTPEIDALVSLAMEQREILGARLTGGGFGGSVVMLCTSGSESLVAHRVSRSFFEKTGLCATVVVPCK